MSMFLNVKMDFLFSALERLSNVEEEQNKCMFKHIEKTNDQCPLQPISRLTNKRNGMVFTK